MAPGKPANHRSSDSCLIHGCDQIPNPRHPGSRIPIDGREAFVLLAEGFPVRSHGIGENMGMAINDHGSPRQKAPLLAAATKDQFPLKRTRGLMPHVSLPNRRAKASNGVHSKRLISPFPFRITFGTSSVRSMMLECSATITPPSITRSSCFPKRSSIS